MIPTIHGRVDDASRRNAVVEPEIGHVRNILVDRHAALRAVAELPGAAAAKLHAPPPRAKPHAEGTAGHERRAALVAGPIEKQQALLRTLEDAARSTIPGAVLIFT